MRQNLRNRLNEMRFTKRKNKLKSALTHKHNEVKVG